MPKDIVVRRALQAGRPAGRFARKNAAVGGLPELTDIESLFDAIRGGVPEARDTALSKLVDESQGLVKRISHIYKHHGLPLADLVSEGNIGLLKAVERFDPEKNVKFNTYATYWIKHHIHRALSNHGKTIRIPAQTAENMRKLRASSVKIMNKLGRSPTEDELASDTGFSQRVVQRLLRDDIMTCSINDFNVRDGDPMGNYGEFPDIDGISPEDILINKETSRQMWDFIHSHLDERERQILRMKYGLDSESQLTLEAIGKKVDLSRERVRQILRDAVKKLRGVFKNQPPPTDGEGVSNYI